MTGVSHALPGWDSRRVHGLVGVLTALWFVGFFLTSGVVRDTLVSAVSFVPAVAVVLVLRARTLGQPQPWWWVLSGLLLLCIHNAVWMVETYVLDIPPATTLLGTYLLPAGYVLLLLGATLMLHQSARQDTGTILDAAIIALSGALLLWVLLVAPALDADAPTASRVRTMAILAVVSGIGGALYRAASLLPARRGSVVYMLVAVLGTLGGTLGRDMTHDTAGVDGAWWVGLLWTVAYLALVGGVMHPTATTTVVDRTAPARLTARRVWALALALSIGPGLLLLDVAVGTEAERVYIAAVNLAVIPLVVLRVGRLARLHSDAERRLAHLADHDHLTGLPNRRVLQRHLATLLPRVAAGRAPGAIVLFADLDDFKAVNDTLGHGVGDELLRAVARRLQRSVRTGERTEERGDEHPGESSSGRASEHGDLVTRFAGDEFVVVVEGDPSLAPQALERMRAALADDVTIGTAVLPATASIGVATVEPGQHMTVDEILSTADARMYERKRERRTAS